MVNRRKLSTGALSSASKGTAIGRLLDGCDLLESQIQIGRLGGEAGTLVPPSLRDCAFRDKDSAMAQQPPLFSTIVKHCMCTE